jgi:hypothetical protein
VSDVLQHAARRALQVIAHQCRAHLDFDERAHQVRPPATGTVQRIQRAVQCELRRLAVRETGNRHLHLCRLQAQLRHDGTRGLDFLLRDPPIGLGNVAHDLEGGAKEPLADLRRRGAGRTADARPPHDGRLGIGIKLVAHEDADRRPDGAAGHQADDATDRFSDPLHTLLY